jgi:hypothetical protein
MNDLALYAKTLYPLFPVVDLGELHARFLAHGHHHTQSPTQYAFLCSLRAAVHAHLSLSSTPGSLESKPESGHGDVCERFLSDALQVRKQYDLPCPQTHPQNEQEHGTDRDRLLSSFFLFMAYWNLRREKHAWWYLRECITLLLSSRIHQEDEYRRLEPRVGEYRRRIFWGIFVAERYLPSSSSPLPTQEDGEI